jgi:putative membrane protein
LAAGGVTRSLLLALLLAAPAAVARAHEGEPVAPHDLWTRWDRSAPLLLPLAVAGGLYWRGRRTLIRRAGRGRAAPPWRGTAFAGGLAALVAALASPLDAAAGALFAAHMIQHLLLVLAAAPLLVLGAPLLPWLWGLPSEWRRAVGRAWRRAYVLRVCWRVLTRQPIAWALHAATLAAWHVPALYQAALMDASLHALEHASMLLTAALFWWVPLHPQPVHRLDAGLGVLHVFAMATTTGLLGALIVLARSPWYSVHTPGAAAWGLTPLQDQQLAGLLMWVPGGLVYLAAALGLASLWLGAAARRRGTRATGG